MYTSTSTEKGPPSQTTGSGALGGEEEARSDDEVGASGGMKRPQMTDGSASSVASHVPILDTSLFDSDDDNDTDDDSGGYDNDEKIASVEGVAAAGDAVSSRYLPPVSMNLSSAENEEEAHSTVGMVHFDGVARLFAHARATGAIHRAAAGANGSAEAASWGDHSASLSSVASALRNGARQTGSSAAEVALGCSLKRLRVELTSTTPQGNGALAIVNATDEAEDMLRRVVSNKAPQQQATETKKLRRLPKVNHSQISYPVVTKNFYVTPPDVRALDEAEVRRLVRELDGAKVVGENAPRPLRTWNGCGLPDSVLGVLERSGLGTPFAVQSLGVPVLMGGRDLLVIAKTGSGKTLTYLLPLLRHASAQPPGGPGEGPVGLLLVPTHELASQVAAAAKDLCRAASCRLVVSSGMVPLSDNIRHCSRGCEVMVATPGRLLDLLTVSGGKVLSLRRASFVVVDEVDRLFDSGFMEHVEAFLRSTRPDRQLAMISATMPREMRKVLMRHLQDPIEISVGGKPTPASNVEQLFFFFNEEVYEVDEDQRKPDERLLKLLEILGYEMKDEQCHLTLIFVNRRDEVDSLFAQLSATGYNGRLTTLHSGMDQLDRQFALEQFTPERQCILIATSVAERGLDFPYLELVVNYSLPDHYEGYVHRIGRTGRAGRKGKAVSFYVRGVDDDIAGDLCSGLERAEQSVPEELYERASLRREKRKAGLVDHHVGFRRGFMHARRQKFTSRDQREQLREAAKAADLEEYLSCSMSDSDDSSDMKKSDADSDGERDGGASRDPEVVPVGASSDAGSDSSGHVCAGNGGKWESTRGASTALAVYRGQRQLTLSATERDNRVAAALQYAHNTTVVSQDSSGTAATTAVKFRAEYEINDLAESARRRLQNGTVLRTIAEECQTTVVRKGVYFDPKLKHSHRMKDGERKLYLLILGRTPEAVRQAIARLNTVRDEAKMKQSKAAGASILDVQL